MTRQPGRPTHVSALLPAILLLAAAPAAAQAPPTSPRWSLTPSMALVHFSDAGVEGESASVGFGRSVSVGLTAGRALGPVTLLLGVEYLTAGFQVRDDVVMFETISADVGRTRLSLLARRTIGHLGRARLSLGAGPTLDIWSPDGADSRTAAGAAAQLILELDAGPFTLENGIGAGFSAGPLETADLPDGYEKRSIRTVAMRVAARFSL